VLAQCGFRLAGLEIPAVGSAGKAVIDALLFHEATNHLVQCESKSGANVDERQAKAYAAMSAQSVVQAAYVPLRQRMAPTLETLYLCQAEHVERIRLGLKIANVSFPVLALSPRRLELFDSEFASDLLREALADGATLATQPSRIIPFDPESLVEEIERHVRATLVAMLTNRTPHISLTGLTEQVARHYALYGHKAQHKLRSTIGSAVAAVVAWAPDRFAYDPPARARPEGLIRFLKTPEDFDRRGRTQGYQALSRDGKSRRARKHPPNPNQFDLLGELGMTDNSDEESLSTSNEEGEQS
jgi:hypothetical protein